MYTQNEQVDMLLMYGESRKYSRAAAALYAQHFTNRMHPPQNYFIRLTAQFRNERDDRINNIEEENCITNDETEINVFVLVEIGKTVSGRQIGHELNISHEKTKNIHILNIR